MAGAPSKVYQGQGFGGGSTWTEQVKPVTSPMVIVWWFTAILLMAVGLICTVIPNMPGPVIILAAAALHQVMLGSEKSLGWWNLAGLGLLTVVSYGLDIGASYFGAKRFGATKWGILGAMLGAIVGLFFPFPGLLVGPVIGAIGGELLAGKRLISAGRAGWGTLLGTFIGILGKLVIGLIMVSWFLLAAAEPF